MSMMVYRSRYPVVRRKREYIRFIEWVDQHGLPTLAVKDMRTQRKIRRALVDARQRYEALKPRRLRASALHTAYRRKRGRR